MSGAYYNENNREAAAWLRELIRRGLIAPGEVDERSIEDVQPADLTGFTQCHFFAGIGTWSYSLRRAGWSDDRRVWTASCPCQPFSTAGKGGGFADERHLWPAFYWLLTNQPAERRPSDVFGEQVASRNGLAWLDVVQADMEAAGYAFGPLDLCAAGVGAPHIRQRIYFMAHSGCEQHLGRHGLRHSIEGTAQAPAGGEGAREGGADEGRRRPCDDAADGGAGGLLADTICARWKAPGRGSELEPAQQPFQGCSSAGGMGHASGAGLAERERIGRIQPGTLESPTGETFECGSDIGGMADTGTGERAPGSRRCAGEARPGFQDGDDAHGRGALGPSGSTTPGPTNGYWRNAVWIPCRDGKARAIEPGTFPLAHGSPARVGRLRGYGNGIVAPAVEEVIRAYQAYLEGCL